MIEEQIITALLCKAAWKTYSVVLDWPQIKAQTPEVYRILLSLKKWHEVNESDLGQSELPVWFFLQYPGMSDKEKEAYMVLFDRIQSHSIRQELITQYLQQMHDAQVRRTLAVMAIDERVPNEKVMEQVAKLGMTTRVEDELQTEFVTTDIDELLKRDTDDPGLMWRLECLNKSIGPLKKSLFGCILARLETGKTALWISEATYMAPQIKDDEHICVFFNEENGMDVMWRLYSAMTGMSAVQIESDPKTAKKLFYERGGQRIKFVDRAQQRPGQMYKILDSLHPRLIIVDNLDKIKGFEDARKDSMLGQIYWWARETAKIYAPLIGISQASAPEGQSRHPKKWLTELDMANSKTEKPGELDFIIAIGRTDDAGYEYVRYINIPKNKARGSKYKDEKDRHGKFIVHINPELSLYTDE